MHFRDEPVQIARFVLRSMLLWLLFATTSLALVDPGLVTDAEMALLPKYCPDTQLFKELHQRYSQADKWVAIMGPGFAHMHHYCAALIQLNRAEKPLLAPEVRNGLRQGALEDLIYVVRAVPPDFVILPEIYTKIGQTELKLNLPDKAGDAFAKARSLKPGYWPAYFHWAEYLQSVGQSAAARTTVEEGLKEDPQAKPLQELLKAMENDRLHAGGKTALPK